MDPSEPTETKAIAYGILGFLDEEFRKPSTSSDSRESLEVAMQCLETAFGVTLRESPNQAQRSLRQIFRAGSEPRQANAQVPNGIPGMDFSSIAAASMAAGYNAGAAGLGTPPRQVVELPMGEPYPKPSSVSDENKKRADELKETGNLLMKEGDFSAALDVYKKAVDLDGGNSVYFCNRAAAYLKVGDLSSALRDVQIALQLQPNYARAYGRMGVIYSSMGKNLEAYSCYSKAVELEPSNESYVNNLRVAGELIDGQNLGGPSEAPMGSIAQIFQNPALMSMASQMLQDPGMQTMMRSIISGLQTGNANASAGDQGFEQLLQMGQAIAAQIGEVNPDLTEQLSNRLRNPNGNQDPPNQNDSYDL